VDGHLQIHMPEIAAMEALGKMKRFAVRMTEAVEPCQIVEADAVDHESITFPFASRIAEPQWLKVRRRFTSVRVDLAMCVVGLIQDHRQGRHLDELDPGGQEVGEGDPRGQTMRGRNVSSQRWSTLLQNLSGFRPDWLILGFDVRENVQ